MLSRTTRSAPLLSALCALALATPFTAPRADLNGHVEVEEFIVEMVQKHGFELPYLRRLFAETHLKESILEAISRPAEAKPWHEYRPIFIQEARIRDGVKFWERHAETLQRAEQRFGVPAEIIIAIIGVETRYGRNTGRYRVLDALSTLAFEYPPRASFFRAELEQFLLMSREEGLDPLELKGSYAGAMGQPQFIASSYRSYAIDFNGDGRRDLLNDIDDVIGSVANYFKRHGWKSGEAIALRATASGGSIAEIVARGYKPSTPVRELRAHGVSYGGGLADETPAALLELEAKERNEYWVALHNFYVITRYNHSPLYAMAVYQLAQAIKERT